jgi:hypothetical protein
MRAVAELVCEEEALHGALQTRGQPRPTLVHITENPYRGGKRRCRMAEHDPVCDAWTDGCNRWQCRMTARPPRRLGVIRAVEAFNRARTARVLRAAQYAKHGGI